MFTNKLYIYGNQNVLVPAHLHIGKHLLNRLRCWDDKIAMENVETDEKITYKGLTQYAVRMAIALSNLGVHQGDVVALGTELQIKFASSVLGIILSGATATIFGIGVGKASLKHKINVSLPKYILCTQLFWEKYEDILKSFQPGIVVLKLEMDLPLAEEVDVELFDPLPVQGQSDTAMIAYSSGTTGMPKGIMLTHLNCMRFCITMFNDQSIKTAYVGGDFEGGLQYIFNMIYSGKKLVIVSNESPKTQLMAFEKGQVNLALLIPSHINLLLKTEIPNNMNIEYIYSYGNIIHKETMKKIKERFPSVKRVDQGYGMTETAGIASGEYAPKGFRLGSVGYPVPGVTVKVVNPETREVLGPNQRGEICTRGYGLMKGYINVDPTTYLDQEGWFKTGDLGYYDEDGYLYVVSRIKDIFKCNGIVVSPLEVETILLSHPGVLEAGVVRKPDPAYEEVAAAFVVRQPGSNVTEQELIDLVADQGSSYMQLRGGVRFVSHLPKNDRGKIIRRSLAEML